MCNRVLGLTPENSKWLDINKSTHIYTHKNLRGGRRIKVYVKVIGKISGIDG